MKILAVASTFPRWQNDTEPPFVFLLCKELTQNGHEVVALVPHAARAKFQENLENVKVYRFPYFFPTQTEALCYGGGMLSNIKKSKIAVIQIPFLFLMEFIFLVYLNLKEKPDIIHAHWAIPQGLTSVIAKIFVRKPIILSVHGSDVFAFRKNRFKKILGWFMGKPNRVTVNSSATKKVLEHDFGVVHSKVIPMGIDVNKFYPSHTNNQGMQILAVGRLVEQKGFQYLIGAMPQIIKEFPKAKLTIIGSGPYKTRLEQLVLDRKLADHVEFLGSIPNHKLPQYYRKADYFVGPSIIADDGSVEAFGVVFLEALASAVAVIASKVGGITDIIRDRYNGLLVEQRNSTQIFEAIRTLEKDNKLKQKIRDNGLYYVEEFFSWPKVAAEFEQVYKELSI